MVLPVIDGVFVAQEAVLDVLYAIDLYLRGDKERDLRARQAVDVGRRDVNVTLEWAMPEISQSGRSCVQ